MIPDWSHWSHWSRGLSRASDEAWAIGRCAARSRRCGHRQTLTDMNKDQGRPKFSRPRRCSELKWSAFQKVQLVCPDQFPGPCSRVVRHILISTGTPQPSQLGSSGLPGGCRSYELCYLHVSVSQASRRRPWGHSRKQPRSLVSGEESGCCRAHPPSFEFVHSIVSVPVVSNISRGGPMWNAEKASCVQCSGMASNHPA